MKKSIALVMIVVMMFSLSAPAAAANFEISATLTQEPASVYVGGRVTLTATAENKGVDEPPHWISKDVSRWISSGGSYIVSSPCTVVDGYYVFTGSMTAPSVPGSYEFEFGLGMTSGEGAFIDYYYASAKHVIIVLPLLMQTPPAAPTAASKTATSVTLTTIPGAEYRINSGSWQSSPTFTGLSPYTEYTFQAQFPKDDSHLASDPSAGAVIRTGKPDATASPAAPTLAGFTTTSVTLNTVVGVQYRMGSGKWQNDPVFSDLTPDTEYTFDIRFTETETTLASSPSDGLVVRTAKLPAPTASATPAAPTAPAAPTVASKTDTSVTLNTVAGAQYRMGSGEWQSSPVFSNLQPGTAYPFTIRIVDAKTALASPASPALTVTTNDTIDIPAAPKRVDLLTILGIIAGFLLVSAAVWFFLAQAKKRKKQNIIP